MTASLWDVESGKELITFKGHTKELNSVVFSPDGKRLATGSLDGNVKLWDVVTGQEVANLKVDQNFVTSVAFSPDGRTLVTGNMDNTVRLWQAF